MLLPSNARCVQKPPANVFAYNSQRSMCSDGQLWCPSLPRAVLTHQAELILAMLADSVDANEVFELLICQLCHGPKPKRSTITSLRSSCEFARRASGCIFWWWMATLTPGGTRGNTHAILTLHSYNDKSMEFETFANIEPKGLRK
jgi:hypothetical protein